MLPGSIVVPGTPIFTGFNTVEHDGFVFKYNSNGGGAAGTYTGTVKIPPNCYLVDVALYGVSLWTGSSTVAAIVGDADDDNGYLVSTNLKATDLLAGEAISVAAGTAMAGGLIGAYVANSAWAGGVYSTSARSITCLITAVGTATAGETHFIVKYMRFSPSRGLGTPVYAAT